VVLSRPPQDAIRDRREASSGAEIHPFEFEGRPSGSRSAWVWPRCQEPNHSSLRS